MLTVQKLACANPNSPKTPSSTNFEVTATLGRRRPWSRQPSMPSGRSLRPSGLREGKFACEWASTPAKDFPADDYIGLDMNRAAPIAFAAHGSQVLGPYAGLLGLRVGGPTPTLTKRPAPLAKLYSIAA
jgi:hypothetical protein